MRYHFLYFCLFAILFFSCISNTTKNSGAEQFTYDDFPSTIKLSGQKILFEEEPLNPVRLFLSDSILFVQNMRSEIHFSLYNINNNSKITDCFLFGNGPQELIAPAIIACEEGIVHILDKPKMKLYSYDIASLCKNEFRCVNEASFNGFPFDMTLLENKLAALIYAPNHQRITFYSMQGDSIDTKGKFPVDKELNLIEQLETYQCYIIANKAKDKIYLFYKLTDLIEIYDQHGKLLKRIQGPDSFLTEMKQVSVGDGAVKAAPISKDICDAYFFPISVDGNIFVLYSGKRNINNTSTQCDQILVFDESGNPLKIFNLDTPIFSIAINPVNQIIYGIARNPEPEIVIFQF